MLANKKQNEEEYDDPKARGGRRRKIICKGRKRPGEQDYSLIWTLVAGSVPIKHLLILPGDCIFPLSNMSMHNLVEDLYIKNSSIKSEGNLELTLSRKIRPFRDLEQLLPLMERIHSPWIPKIKKLLLGEYRDYIEQKKKERQELAQFNKLRSSEYDANLMRFIKGMPEAFYRYQLRGSNVDYEMQMKRIGFSQSLINLLYPQSTDILVQNTPVIFSTLESYIKYMYHNLLSLVNGGVMDWVEIQLQTVDDITISTRFKNIYYTSPASDQLATITVFEISQNAIDTVNYIRQETTGRNILTKVNAEAERFFNRFYSTKESEPKRMCGFAPI